MIAGRDLRCGLQEPRRLGRDAGATGRAETFGVVLLPQSATDQPGGRSQAWLRRPRRVTAATTRRRPTASAAAGGAHGGAGTAERAAAGADDAEGLGHHEGAQQPAQQRAARATAPSGGQEPERDFEQDVEQGQCGDYQADGTERGAEQADPAGEDGADRHHEHEGLAELNSRGQAEGFPPPAGDRVGVRQGVAHEEQRPGDDQNEGDDDPHDVDQQQPQRQHDQDESDQDREQAADARAGDRLLQGAAQRGRGDTGAEHGQGQRVGQPDDLVGEEQGQGAGQEPQHDPRPDLLDRVARLDAFVGHHQDAADDDQQPVDAQHDLPVAAPQLGDTRQLIQSRGGQHRLAQQVQHRGQGGVDQAGEHAADRGGDAAGDVEDPAVTATGTGAATTGAGCAVGWWWGGVGLRDAVFAGARWGRAGAGRPGAVGVGVGRSQAGIGEPAVQVLAVGSGSSGGATGGGEVPGTAVARCRGEGVAAQAVAARPHKSAVRLMISSHVRRRARRRSEADRRRDTEAGDASNTRRPGSGRPDGPVPVAFGSGACVVGVGMSGADDLLKDGGDQRRQRRQPVPDSGGLERPFGGLDLARVAVGHQVAHPADGHEHRREAEQDPHQPVADVGEQIGDRPHQRERVGGRGVRREGNRDAQ